MRGRALAWRRRCASSRRAHGNPPSRRDRHLVRRRFVAPLFDQNETAGRRLATEGIPERAAGLGHPRVGKCRHASTKRSPGDGVDVVEVHYAIARNAIQLRGELEFRHQTPLGSRQRRHRHRSNPVCDRITRQHEHRATAAWDSGKPDLTAPHRPRPRPSPPNPLPVPNQRSRLATAPIL